MDLWLTHCTLAALIFPLIFPGTQGTTAELRNGTAIKNTILEPGQSFKRLHADVHPSALERSDAKAGGVSGGEDNAKRSLVKISEGRTGSTESSTVTSSQTSDSPSTDSSFKDHSSRPNVDNESSICKGCGEEGNAMRMPPVRSLLSDNNGEEEEPVTRMVWPFSREALDLEIRKKLLKSGIVRESQEDYGSGYHHVQEKERWETHPSSLGKERDLDEFMEKATASPSQTTITLHSELSSPSTEKAISPDSAEIDHLLQVSSETVLQTPSPSQDQMNEKAKTEVGFEVGKSQEPRIVSEKAARGVEGSPDIAMVTEKIPSASGPSVQPVNPDKPSEAPPEHSVDDPINFDYYDLFEGHEGLGHLPGSSDIGGDSTKKTHEKKVPWPMPELYDDFTPFDESDFYPTTSFYADGDEEGGVDDDDDDDDIEDTEDAEDDDTGARELVNVPRSATLMPKIQTIMVGEKPTGRQHTPHQTYILYGGEVHPKFHPEINKDLTQTISGSNDSSAECRNGYVRRNNSCKSVCDLYPTYCYNGGQCYIVENMGAFCRCNTQDYIWHKGMRCESIITDFQVMCVAVGTAALVVLLLFMMTVFFAKKLYLLKTENYKLRKRNRYRTPSELHNDNFSLSTIAEGSHPNEDPNAAQKVQDLPKACLKDEEPFNIQNSLSPKLESAKGDPNIADVSCVLNNLT